MHAVQVNVAGTKKYTAKADKTSESCPKGVANPDRFWCREIEGATTSLRVLRLTQMKRKIRPRQGLGGETGVGQEGQDPRQQGNTRKYMEDMSWLEVERGEIEGQEVGEVGWRNQEPGKAARARGNRAAGPCSSPAFPEPISTVLLPRTNGYANQ